MSRSSRPGSVETDSRQRQGCPRSRGAPVIRKSVWSERRFGTLQASLRWCAFAPPRNSQRAGRMASIGRGGWLLYGGGSGKEERVGFISWIVVGAIAGFIASRLAGGGGGLIGTIVLGII